MNEMPRPRKLQRNDALLILFGALSLFFGFGWHYLESNQHQYLLFALHHGDPKFLLPSDWYVNNTTEYHFVFGYFSWMLSKLGPLKITTIIANGFCFGMLSAGLLLIARNFSEKKYSLLFLLTLFWILAARNTDAGLGLLYMWSEYLQPTQVAGTMLILAVGLFFDRRYLAAGLLTGIAGGFHGSFIASSSLVFAALIIYEKLWQRRGDFLKFTVPIVIIFGTISSVVLLTLFQNPPIDPNAVNIFPNFRCPHHYLISHWNTRQSIAWLLFTLSGGYVLWRKNNNGGNDFRRIQIAWGALMVVTAAGALFAGIIDVPQINTITLFRVAPLAFLLSLMALEMYWIRFFTQQPLKWTRHSIAGIALFTLIPLIWVCMENELEFTYRLLWLAAVPAAVWIHRHLEISPAKAAKYNNLIERRVTIVLIVLISAVALLGFSQRSTVWHPMSPNLETLVAWAEKNAPDTAIFIVPPSYEYANLRVRAHKALVVDLRTCPMLLPEVEEWYQRIQDVTGVQKGKSPGDACTSYQTTMDAARLTMLKKKYGATHIVMDKHRPVSYLKQLTPVYQNPGYAVYRIP